MKTVQIDDCVFCRELSGRRDTNFSQRYPELTGRYIAGSDTFVAFPCIGQLMPSHFLVVPRLHSSTMHEVLIGDIEIREELQLLLQNVHSILGLQIESSLMFEHGAKGPESGGCGIYHAHLHVLPGAGAILPNKIYAFNSDATHTAEMYADLRNTDTGSYVMVGSQLQGFFFEEIKVPLPSQTLRRQIANLIGQENWDWRQVGRESSMINVLEMVTQ